MTNETTKDCDGCDGRDCVTATRENDEFTYGRGDEAKVLTAEVTVWRCRTCGFSFTDGTAEDARDEAVRAAQK